MHSKVIPIEAPQPTKKSRGRPRSVSISEPIESPTPKVEQKIVPIPIVEPPIVILEKKKKGRPKKMII